MKLCMYMNFDDNTTISRPTTDQILEMVALRSVFNFYKFTIISFQMILKVFGFKNALKR